MGEASSIPRLKQLAADPRQRTPVAEAAMFEWRFDRNFRLTVTSDAGISRVTLFGDLDAVTAKNLKQRAQLPPLADSVVLDLTELETADAAGVGEIRRIAALSRRCQMLGAREHVRDLLNLIPTRAQAQPELT